VSLKSKKGPVNAHTTMSPIETKNVVGLPTTQAMPLAS